MGCDAAASAGADIRLHQSTKGQIFAWGLWDWGSSGFNTVIVTFVFSVYLTDSVGKDLPGPIEAGTWYTWSIAAAGVLIAVLAPVTGQQADAGGRRKRSLAVFSALVFLCIAGLFWVRDDYRYFFLGASLIGLGSVFFEVAAVFYNAMLRQISTRGHREGLRIRLVDGLPRGHLPAADLLLRLRLRRERKPYQGHAGDQCRRRLQHPAGRPRGGRVVRAVGCTRALHDPGGAARAAAGARRIPAQLPVAVPRRRPVIPGGPPDCAVPAGQRDLPGTASRGSSISAPSWRYSFYQISAADVLIFGAVANIVAALGALIAGFFDDRVGPKAVIVMSLVGLLATGGTLIFLSGPAAFWFFGLILSLFVGPAQSASRTYLARMATPGKESQIFGLYATTGRAVSFLAPALYGLCTVIFGGQRYGIIGIMVVLATGLVALLRVPKPVDKALVPSA
jgi:UMF1 family MFS transporter